MQNNAKLIALIKQTITFMIESNSDAVVTRTQMQLRKKKISIVKDYYETFFSHPLKNIFIRMVQKTHLDGYPYKYKEYDTNAFAVLDKERHLVKVNYEYHLASVEGDMIISYGNADLKPNPFDKAFSQEKGYKRAIRIILKKEYGFIIRQCPGGRDEGDYTISLASEEELTKLYTLVQTLL